MKVALYYKFSIFSLPRTFTTNPSALQLLFFVAVWASALCFTVIYRQQNFFQRFSTSVLSTQTPIYSLHYTPFLFSLSTPNPCELLSHFYCNSLLQSFLSSIHSHGFHSLFLYVYHISQLYSDRFNSTETTLRNEPDHKTGLMFSNSYYLFYQSLFQPQTYSKESQLSKPLMKNMCSCIYPSEISLKKIFIQESFHVF